MSGYNGFSKSNNAVEAESDLRFPATKAGKILGIPGKFVKEHCSFACGGEWHHTSKYYNTTPYYDIESIQAWMDGEDEWKDYGDFNEVLKEWKNSQKKSTVTIYENVTVEWIEWTGTRNHPKAKEMKISGCRVEDAGGKFVTVIFPDGGKMKKGRDTRGFQVSDAKGGLIIL